MDSKNLRLSYYSSGAVNNRVGLLNLTQIVANSQLDAQSIGKSLVGAKPIRQRKKRSERFINLEAPAPSESLGGLFKCPFKVHQIPL